MRKFANIAKKSASVRQYHIKMTGKLCKLANIAKMGPSATQGEHLIKILGQMWKLANITKMGLSEDQQQ